jgi:hypothetical protein
MPSSSTSNNLAFIILRQLFPVEEITTPSADMFQCVSLDFSLSSAPSLTQSLTPSQKPLHSAEECVVHFLLTQYAGGYLHETPVPFGLPPNPTICLFIEQPIAFHWKHWTMWQDNSFLTASMLDRLNSVYFCLRKCRRGFQRLVRHWRFRRAPVQIRTDLFLNDIDVAAPTTFALLQQNHLYYFTLQNLTHMIRDAMLYGQLFFAEPRMVKNPYNNLPLTKADMYNIYFAVQQQYVRVPEILERLFAVEFDVYLFKRQNYPWLRNQAIARSLRETTPSAIRQVVEQMFHDYGVHSNNPVNIDARYPIHHLMEEMVPYLELYYRVQYSSCDHDREVCDNELTRRIALIEMQYYQYGQRKSATEFHRKLPVFREYYMPVYMETHQYSEAVYNRYISSGHTEQTFRLFPTEYLPARNDALTANPNPSTENAGSENPLNPSTTVENDDEEEDARSTTSSTSSTETFWNFQTELEEEEEEGEVNEDPYDP